MKPLILCLFLLMDQASTLNLVPRKFVPYDSAGGHTFHQDGVLNYSTMLLREDLDLLMVGASGMVFALDLYNISRKNDSVEWKAPPERVAVCAMKGKDPAIDCMNQIKTLLNREDNQMQVCGTYAFDPKCDYMSYENGSLTLQNKSESGVGRSPYNPFERSAAVVLENTLYSATTVNFRSTRSLLMSMTKPLIRTMEARAWFYDPEFVSLATIPKSETQDGEDQVYLFFTETAVEYDSYKPLLVSRVARVCKGDLGGLRTLQDTWSSFIKARLECPVPGSLSPYVVQDAYHWCDPGQDESSCLIFAVFTPQTSLVDISAVCAYRVSDISKIFAEGRFLTQEQIGVFSKWVTFNNILPVPRPGSCIDDEARKAGYTRSLDLPDKTLQFIKKNPLLADPVMPVGNKPLLLKKGVRFTRIVVDHVQSVDGSKHHVMFISTEGGTIVKAVNYNGEMFIIEEVQVFKNAEPIKILKFSNATQQIYAGSDSGVVQQSVSSCGRSVSCVDCLLARDPYCGWDPDAGQCIAVSATHRDLVQSLKNGSTSPCPEVQTEQISLAALGYLRLPCSPKSSLETLRWKKDDSPLESSPDCLELQDGLLFLNVSISDAGLYQCLSVWRSREVEHLTLTAQYNVTVRGATKEAGLEEFDFYIFAHQAGLVLVFCSFFGIVIWNFYKGHIRLPCRCGRTPDNAHRRSQVHTHLNIANRAATNRVCYHSNMNLTS